MSKKAQKLSPIGIALAFRNITGHGNRGSTHLIRKTVRLTLRKEATDRSLQILAPV